VNEREFGEKLEAATLAYQPGFRSDDRPVVIEVGVDAETPAGDVLLCALVNQLARTHRQLVLVGDLQRPLLCRDPFGAQTVVDATVGNATAINPLIAVEVVEKAPQTEAIARFAIGGGAGMALGSSGWLALAGEDAHVGEAESDIWGAMYASVLGAWFAFGRQIDGNPRLSGSYSAWHYGKPGGADGPRLSSLGDLGRVLQVGAGGVGAALDYWLAIAELDGAWTIADGDRVEVGNLNRQLIFNAADAGYPDGEAQNKAERAAARLGLGAQASERWYGEEAEVVAQDYDVILALANERGAREALGDRRGEVLLHATTSPNYQAQLHRHLADVDDCIRCRLPGAAVQTACATGTVAGTASDAALPFLSGLAGLMLLPALVKRSRAELAQENANLTVVDLSGHTVAQQSLRLQCRDGCPNRVRQISMGE
jgi:hypothetical protein